MNSKNKLWLNLFLLIGILDILFTAEGLQDYRYFSKTLILPVLLLYFFQSSKYLAETNLRKAVVAALIFSWVGDVLLLFPNLFLFGLGAFLMAHICYILSFKLAQFSPFSIGNVNFIRLFFVNLPIYIAAAFVYYLIQPNLSEMKIPVVIYLIVIVMMVTTARERYQKTIPASFWQVFVGGVMFMISDAILAINLFFKPFPESGVLVMGTYIIAQFLIVRGILAHVPRQEQI